MAKVAKELSALAVSRLAKDGAHAVGGVAGLQLQIIGSSKVWVLRFALYGRRRRMGFGPYPAVSLASARDLARKAHDLIRNGQDPINERQAKIDAQTVDTSNGMTFKRAAEQFIAAHESGWSNAKHRLQWVSTIGTYALPVIGPLQVDQIEQRHILQILEPIWRSKTETALRLRGRIEQILSWSKVRGFRDGPNPARWRDHLDLLLPSPEKISKVKHHPAVSLSEAHHVWTQICEVSGLGAQALRLQILTAVRSGEARGALLIPLGLLVAKGMLLRWVLAKIGVSAGATSVFKTLFSWGSKALPVIARFAPMLLRLLGPIGLVITAGWMIYNNWQAMWDGCVAIWEDFSTWFMGLMSGFGSWIGSMWNSATTMASTALNAFVSGVLNLIDGGVGAWVAALLNFSPFGLLWNAFTAALAALGIQVPEQFRSFGGFIMDGLIGGITGRLAALKDAVVGAASSAATWFKEKLGIASPSKLFTQFGGWISEGAANGTTAGQAGVRAAALAMAGAAAAPVGAVGIDGGTAPIGAGPSIAPRISAPAPAAGGNYTFQIYAAPGMDAQAIARAVRAEIENIDRQKASRGRSSMHDLS